MPVNPYGEWNYQGLPGFAGKTIHDGSPWGKEIPQNAVEYAQYKRHYEDIMLGTMNENNEREKQGFVSLTANCEEMGENGFLRKVRLPGGKLPAHQTGSSIVFCCMHCLFQDPVHPEGIVFVPFNRENKSGYFVCKTCLKLLESYKMDIGRDICPKCSLCLCDSIAKIVAIDPTKLKDLSLI